MKLSVGILNNASLTLFSSLTVISAQVPLKPVKWNIVKVSFWNSRGQIQTPDKQASHPLKSVRVVLPYANYELGARRMVIKYSLGANPPLPTALKHNLKYCKINDNCESAHMFYTGFQITSRVCSEYLYINTSAPRGVR